MDKISRAKRALYCSAAAAICWAAFEVALRITPFPTPLTAPFSGSTEFLDRTGRPLRTMLVDERRYARPVNLDNISPVLIDATISAEDQRFRRHPGIDPLAIARAAFDAAAEDGVRSGASTITQQLVKIAQPGKRTWQRKLREAWLALRVERAWPKDRILSEYLNRLDYGNLQVGVASASRFYFGKPPCDLSPAEGAFLAALPKAPTRLNPHDNLPAAIERQRWILGRMLKLGRLDQDEYDRAIGEKIALKQRGHDFEAPHFVDLLLTRKGTIPTSGGPVTTTLDLPLNQLLEQSLNEQLTKIADKHATSGAAVVIHNPTGEVLALACSGDYFQTGTGQSNGAWMIRSPGSAVKPFTYILALEAGANPSTIVADVPTEFPTESGLYRPNNYNHRFYGPVSLRFALGNSLNVGAIRALQLGGGPDALYQRLIDLGITTLGHPANYYGLGLTIGNGEVRLLELANAFATIGRLGMHRPYQLLAPGNTTPSAGRRVMDERATYLVADMLTDNTARAASFGLDSFLAFPFPVACKTGTSSDYRDNWALGCTPEYTVGVWVGNVDGSPMQGITGVTGAAPVMHEVFTHLHKQRGTSWFSRPPGIIDAKVHPLTGRSVPWERAGSVTEKCMWPPELEREADFDERGRVVLATEYTAWLASPQNNLGNLATSGTETGRLRIVTPKPGATYFFDPDIPAVSQRLQLRAEGGALEWKSPTLVLDDEGARQLARLAEGRHVITVRDRESGAVAETWIEVKPL